MIVRSLYTIVHRNKCVNNQPVFLHRLAITVDKNRLTHIDESSARDVIILHYGAGRGRHWRWCQAIAGGMQEP